MVFVSWNKNLIQLKGCQKTSFPLSPRAEFQTQGPLILLCTDALLEGARALFFTFLSFSFWTNWGYNPRKRSKQEEGWRRLLVIAAFWEASSSSDCVWSRDKYRKSTGGRVDGYYFECKSVFQNLKEADRRQWCWFCLSSAITECQDHTKSHSHQPPISYTRPLSCVCLMPS